MVGGSASGDKDLLGHFYHHIKWPPRCPQVPGTTSRCFELSLNITEQMVGLLQTPEAIKESLTSKGACERAARTVCV